MTVTVRKIKGAAKSAAANCGVGTRASTISGRGETHRAYRTLIEQFAECAFNRFAFKLMAD
ncbi:hypothetical protein BN2476_370020 [Paraburkholderia piptadeniae]|uniref:Uncharacterized protein n=1 Tax=Paraburkholderia piptadeniae TaxID=1701573 RepID=A0A1N7S9D7_9BURK|nr:hypothetical protein [Paraburkholderia piptadeniae]SIT44006.1 hypothetical protein BN2476_370020 [Paraburkholderia piptadeniae]